MNNYVWLEILVIIAIMIFFTLLLANFIYKKVKHIPSDECECYKSKKNKLVKEYRKAYKQ